MKYAALFALTLGMNFGFAQTSITLQPDASQGKDAWINSGQSTNNYGDYPNFAAIAWTSGGEFISRGLIDFDLSSIPANATITSAKLSLYCNTTSDHTQLHSGLSGSNACFLQRVTSSWTENAVNWNNQPTTSAVNQVTLPASTSNTQDYLNIDVLNLIKDIKSNPSSSFGIMLKLETEAKYRSLIFANSDHLTAAKRPKLVIEYTVGNNTCIKIKPNAADGKDAWINSGQASNNYGTYPNFAAIAWTSGGEFISRGLIDFNLNSIPANATIESASLDLYCNTTSDHTQLHSSLSGSNACVLQRITSSWTENAVNWNNQPSTSNTNEITLAQSTSQTQDYLNINVLPLILDMRANPSNSFGLMMKLATEAKYRSLIFANSDHADSTKWPVLTICYKLPSAVKELTNKEKGQLFMYPNPISNLEVLQITKTNEEEALVSIIDIQGKIIFTQTFAKGANKIEINFSQIGNLCKGTYFVKLDQAGATSVTKLIVQ